MKKNETRPLYVSKSGIDSRGLFSSRTFDFMETVYQPYGKIVHSSEIDWDGIGKQGYDGFLQVGAWEYLDGRKDRNFRNLNHSCDPNLGFKMLEGIVSLVAIKPIVPGREVVFDYSTTMFEEEDEQPMPCKCGADNCRGVISDFRLLPRDLQKKYIGLGIVPNYVLNKCTMEKPSIDKRLWHF